MAKKRSRIRGGNRGRVAPEPGAAPGAPRVQDVPFHVTARRRYLNYAISVITARALPDVRDGLKPVQRRILYTMQNDLHLGPAAKPLKCARIVGDVLGKYHPHGDAAVYEALVRMAQDFSLRYPLIDGHGNFGSLDGDSPAAYRYTEARLRPLSMELLAELLEETVDFRANYDGRTREPAVLPARLPNLLLNGATGIAVGMATNIPPHNLTEVALACEALIDDRDASVADLMKHVKGPDFPTGGQILNSRADLRKIYEDGQGSIRVRAEYTVEGTGRGMPRVIITSIPYMVQKDVLVRAIADIIFARKVPQLVDVRDESTADVRIVCELKKDADPALVMAYLYKHTQLQANFNVNLTCLVPGATPPDSGGAAIPVSTPARVDLKTILSHFLDFRYQVVERRFRHELKLLLDRIHILEGFRKVFNALDEAIRIIRGADGREDAAEKLKERFKLDDAQAAAILDLRLYKLAKLEIKAILDELREKKARVEEIEAILKSSRKLWGVVKDELKEAREKFADERRTKVGGRDVEEVEYDEEAFIVDEDAHVILSRDGWVRRVGRVGDIAKARLRPDDEVLGVAAGNTKSTVVFFSNLGFAYTVRLNDIPPSRGYGEPLPSLFKFRDGERAIAVLSLDPRVLADIGKVPAAEEEEEASPRKKGKKGKQEAEPEIPGNHAFVVSSSGYTSRFGLAAFAEPSTRAGRKFLRVREGEEVAGVHAVTGGETAVLATRKGRVTLFPVAQVNFLSGPGRGVRGIKCAKDDRVIGSVATADEKVGLVLVRPNGNEIKVSPSRYRTASRGGKGVEVVKRGGLARVKPPEIAIPELGGEEEADGNGKDEK